MLRNVGGIWFMGNPATDRWNMHRWECNGHAEVSITRPIDWKEVDPEVAARLGADWTELQAKWAEEDADERRERNRKRAARRAVVQCRRLIKARGLNTLLTLTYRENQTDLALCKEHFKAFVRRAKRALGMFRYVAAFEQQERGAWHVHIVTDKVQPSYMVKWIKVKSFDLLRRLWRDVVGDLGGTCNVARMAQNKRQSIASLAKYVSKYLLKAFVDGDDWSNRYSASQDGGRPPKPMLMEFRGAMLADLIDLAFSDVAVGDCSQTTWLSRWGDVFYLATEPAPIGAS